VIGDRHELDRTELTASNTNWLADVPQDTPTECLAQIRYNAAPEPATLTRLADNRLAICFATPQFGVCPGQAVVCYDGPRVLGGGWIDS
jgi:tRNA-specific 2-thiouridylase